MAREDKLAAAAAQNTSVDTGVKGTVDGDAPQEAAQVQSQEPVVQDPVAAVDETAGAEPEPAQTEPEPAADPVAAVTKVRETNDVGNVAGVQQSAPRNGSPLALTLIAQWDSYIQDAAANKSQTPRTVAQLRDRLINLLTITVNAQDNRDFMQVSNYLLKEIQANRTGAFNLSMVHRGFGELPGATANKPRFALDAYLCFADPQGRAQNIAQYNIVNSAQLANTSELRDRFVAYFNRISGKR